MMKDLKIMINKFLRTAAFWFLIALGFSLNTNASGPCGDVCCTWMAEDGARMGFHMNHLGGGYEYMRGEQRPNLPCTHSLSRGFLVELPYLLGRLGAVAGGLIAIAELYGKEQDVINSNFPANAESFAMCGSSLAGGILSTVAGGISLIGELSEKHWIRAMRDIAVPIIYYTSYAIIKNNLISVPCSDLTCTTLNPTVESTCGGLLVTAGVLSLQGLASSIYTRCCFRR